MSVEIWTDGGCYPNPNGCGGWAAVVRIPGKPDIELSGSTFPATNNRMELTAVIRALASLPPNGEVTVTLDSRYVMSPFTQGWIESWRQQRFVNRPNADLWVELYRAVKRQQTVTWVWVRGHRDNVEHNRADELAGVAWRALAAEMRADGERFDL